jgi:hypothetical protein
MSYLPPESRKELISETVKLIAWNVGFIVILGIVVVLTQGIVIKIG